MKIEEFKKNKLRECLEEQGCSKEVIGQLMGFLPKHPEGDFSISYQKLCSIIDEAIEFALSQQGVSKKKERKG